MFELRIKHPLLLCLPLLAGCGATPDLSAPPEAESLGEVQEALTGDAPLSPIACNYSSSQFPGGAGVPTVKLGQNELVDRSPFYFSLQLSVAPFRVSTPNIEVQASLLLNGSIRQSRQQVVTCTPIDLSVYQCQPPPMQFSDSVQGDYGAPLSVIDTNGPVETILSCGSTAPVRAPVYRSVSMGYDTLPRGFANLSGDGGADFCRFVGNSASPSLSCALAKSQSSGFGNEYELMSAAGIDLGYSDTPRVFADINGDTFADFCRFRGPQNNRYVTCDLAGPNGFTGDVWNSALGVDLGYSDTPRVFVDVNDDLRADFCRFRGDPAARYITCDLAGASGFEGTLNSAPGVDLGYSDTARVFVDVNDDQRADFCRFRGPPNARHITCDLATPTGFQSEALKSPPVDLGYDDAPRLFGDVDKDGRADFCRFRGDPNNRHLQCNVTSPNGAPLATVKNSLASIAPGVSNLPAALVDVNNDQRADFCRVRNMNSRTYLQCNLANDNLFENDSIAQFRSAYHY